MSKHTPGPWKRIRNDGAGHVIIDGAAADAVGIASVHRYDRHDVEANADLIVAAPELLEACITALKRFNALRFDTAAYDDVVTMLERAITNAQKGA